MTSPYKTIKHPVKQCPICQRQWEKYKEGSANKLVGIIYYDYLPTYGLVRLICPKCKQGESLK